MAKLALIVKALWNFISAFWILILLVITCLAVVVGAFVFGDVIIGLISLVAVLLFAKSLCGITNTHDI